VQSKVIKDPSFLFRWWGLEESDAWDDPEAWERANPNYGESVSKAFLEAEALKAKHQPARQNTFRRLYLNEWTQAESRWIDLGVWDRTAGLVSEEKLEGRECCGGLDLASKSDLAALCWDFPNEDGTHDAIWRFFTPRENLAELDKRTAGQASVWAREGFLLVEDGAVVTDEFVFAQIMRDAKRFNIRRIGYDRWGAWTLRTRLEDEEFELAEIGQGFASMSPASKDFEQHILERKYRHGGNPVMRWMIDNVVVRTDPAANIKPDKQKSSEKIDGVVAAIMAHDTALRVGTAAVSAYDDHDLIVFG
jgi:phage terminase large subunit-like protein